MAYEPRQFSDDQIAIIEAHRNKYSWLREIIDERVSILKRIAANNRRLENAQARILGLPTGGFLGQSRAAIATEIESLEFFIESDLNRLGGVESDIVAGIGESFFKDYHEDYKVQPADSGRASEANSAASRPV